MSMIDYGTLVKINKKLVNENQFFMDMEKAVGWIDCPRIKYEDCNCIDDGYSDCKNCPRAQTKHYSDIELGEWDFVTGDCRGNAIEVCGKIDGNFFAYAGDEDFTVAVYKTYAKFINKNRLLDEECYGLELTNKSYEDINQKVVRYFTLQTATESVNIKIKKIANSDRQYYMTFKYKGNYYEIIYGYGIDSNIKVWNKDKHTYCTKKVIKFVDDFLK